LQEAAASASALLVHQGCCLFLSEILTPIYSKSFLFFPQVFFSNFVWQYGFGANASAYLVGGTCQRIW